MSFIFPEGLLLIFLSLLALNYFGFYLSDTVFLVNVQG